MAQVSATPIREFQGVIATDDGKHALIKAALADGAEMVLAVPHNQLGSLIDHAALGIAQGEKAQGFPADQRSGSLTVSWWELCRDTATGAPLLALKTPGGGRIDFRLTAPMLDEMFETLGVMLGKLSPPSPTSPAN